ncbi:unnamed protein product, partial [Musa acuminata var. zebrina]
MPPENYMYPAKYLCPPFETIISKRSPCYVLCLSDAFLLSYVLCLCYIPFFIIKKCHIIFYSLCPFSINSFMFLFLTNFNDISRKIAG